MLSIIKTRDARVVAQVLAGQRNEFDILVERYLPAVYAVSYARLHNHFDAEDATQETFLSAFRSLRQLREPKKFEVWLVGIARRTATKMWEKRKREAESGVAETKSHTDAPDIAQEELRHLLRREIQQLDYDAREILLLHYFAGKRTGEIAASLDISREAAKKRLQRARQSLGERMLDHIECDSQPASGFQKQRRAIMGLVGAAALGWGDGASAATPLAANGSAKVMAIAAAALVAGVGVFFALQPSDDESVVSPPAGPVAEAVSPSETVRPPEAVVEFEPAPEAAPASPTVVGAAENSDVGGNRLTGLWRVCDSLGMLADTPIMQVDQSGNDIDLRLYRADGSGPTVASGNVEADQIRLAVESGDVSELAGVIQDENVLILSAMVLEGEPPAEVEITLTRTSERDLAEIEIQEQRMAELETIAQALKAYAAKNDGSNPETLGLLAPEFLKQPQLIESAPSRRIRYVPDGIWSLDTTKVYPENTPHAEQLLLTEADRRAEWTAFPTMEPVLTVTYSTPSMTLVYRSADRPQILRVDSDSPMKCPPPRNEMPTAQQDALRASCQNNLNQLGVVLKMFEDAEERFAGGWASMLPKYLVDTIVLTCPGLREKDVPGRTVSYTLLFPATSEEELLEVSAHLGSEAESDAKRLAVIPLVTEVHECAQSGGSHVLFADGHIEWLAPDAWEDRIGPYADYAATVR